jgi:hypothetical protein
MFSVTRIHRIRLVSPLNIDYFANNVSASLFLAVNVKDTKTVLSNTQAN